VRCSHPPTYAVREEPVLAALDDWLSTFTDSDHIDATVESILKADKGAEIEPLEVTQAWHQERRLVVELNRIIAAIRAGMDPVLASGQPARYKPALRRPTQ
jgi:hypothetical protein